ncbi:MAG: hypothetical protein PUC26_05855 [Eubacteriales bacterium]|nr:hypothetical protein [Eubacteriales bacterium]
MKFNLELTPTEADKVLENGTLTALIRSICEKEAAAEASAAPKEKAEDTAPTTVRAETPTQIAPAMPTAVPTSKPTFTQEQLALAATQLMDAGKQEELIKVLQDMGVPSLANLDPEKYADFAARIRGLGAKI